MRARRRLGLVGWYLVAVVVALVWYYRSLPDDTPKPFIPPVVRRSRPSIPYQVLEIPHAIDDKTCRRWRILSLKHLQKSRVIGKQGERTYSATRISQSCILPDHPSINQLHRMATTLTGYPLSHQEQIQITRYGPGGKFESHYDCNPKNLDQPSWSRCATLMVYLNDSFVGGETEFPQLERMVQPEKGKALLFWSVDTDGELILDSFHSGKTVRAGVKWIATIWIHTRPIPRPLAIESSTSPDRNQ